METGSRGVLDENKERYLRSKDKAEKSYDVLWPRFMPPYVDPDVCHHMASLGHNELKEFWIDKNVFDRVIHGVQESCQYFCFHTVDHTKYSSNSL